MDTGSSALKIVSVSLLVTEEEKQSLGESLTGLKLSAATKSRANFPMVFKSVSEMCAPALT